MAGRKKAVKKASRKKAVKKASRKNAVKKASRKKVSTSSDGDGSLVYSDVRRDVLLWRGLR